MSDLSRQDVIHGHLRNLRIASLGTWVLTVLLLYSASLLPLFDSSPLVLHSRSNLKDFLTFPLLRWDVFYFTHIAQEGYVYEQEWAFFSGIALVMRWTAAALRAIGLSRSSGGGFTVSEVLGGAAILSSLCGSTTTLYHLTLLHFGSPSIAYLSALLSLLPSSPATLRFSACTEPFFTYLSYRGMLHCAKSEWVRAILCFMVASTFRSNGILLVIFVLWGLLLGPLLDLRPISMATLIKVTFSMAAIFLPFVSHQYMAYVTFCVDGPLTATRPPWCSKAIPSVYGYVQDKYWNVGFLRYWTVAQAPNILLAAPVLLTATLFDIAHLRACTIPAILQHPLFSWLQRFSFVAVIPKPVKSPFFQRSIIPHVLHSSVMCFILLFAAHTQIALRLAASMPITYWAAAWLLVEKPRYGNWWISWSVLWGVISIVLWAVFLPPA